MKRIGFYFSIIAVIVIAVILDNYISQKEELQNTYMNIIHTEESDIQTGHYADAKTEFSLIPTNSSVYTEAEKVFNSDPSELKLSSFIPSYVDISQKTMFTFSPGIPAVAVLGHNSDNSIGYFYLLVYNPSTYSFQVQIARSGSNIMYFDQEASLFDDEQNALIVEAKNIMLNSIDDVVYGVNTHTYQVQKYLDTGEINSGTTTIFNRGLLLYAQSWYTRGDLDAILYVWNGQSFIQIPTWGGSIVFYSVAKNGTISLSEKNPYFVWNSSLTFIRLGGNRNEKVQFSLQQIDHLDILQPATSYDDQDPTFSSTMANIPGEYVHITDAQHEATAYVTTIPTLSPGMAQPPNTGTQLP